MAKQSGIHQLRGKMRGVSYYSQKYVEGGLARSINEGLSQRVKTAPEYENTRKNAREFGASGSTTGAAIRPLSQRWRYVLNPFATGFANKAMLLQLKQDTTGDWGERGFEGDAWKSALRNAINSQVKNDFLQYFVKIGATLTGLTSDGVATISSETAFTARDFAEIKALGAEGITFELYALDVQSSIFVDPEIGYSRATSKISKLIGTTDIEIGDADTINLGGTTDSGFENLDSPHTGAYACMLVVAKPFVVVNNTKHVLQELCSAMMFEHDNEI